MMTHDKLVEKVARAICDAENHDEDEWLFYTDAARAAVAAVAEECAKVADYGKGFSYRSGSRPQMDPGEIAAAIRKLGETK
jgi:hypothetical protein